MEAHLETPSDDALRFVAANIRVRDRFEAEDVFGVDVLAALRRKAAASRETGTLVCEEGVAGVFGVVPAPMTPGEGEPWLVCSRLVDGRGVSLYRNARRLLSASERRYGCLRGHVWTGSHAALRWLPSLGFALGGISGRSRGRAFREFRREAG